MKASPVEARIKNKPLSDKPKGNTNILAAIATTNIEPNQIAAAPIIGIDNRNNPKSAEINPSIYSLPDSMTYQCE